MKSINLQTIALAVAAMLPPSCYKEKPGATCERAATTADKINDILVDVGSDDAFIVVNGKIQDISAETISAKTTIVSEKELEPENQEIATLAHALLTKLSSKYPTTTFETNSGEKIIHTPNNKRVMIVIQDGGKLVNINYDTQRRYQRAHGSGGEILQINLGSNNDPNANTETKAADMPFYTIAGIAVGSEVWGRLSANDVVTEGVKYTFEGNGKDYGGASLDKVFAAFGLSPDVPPHKKAAVILQILIDQL